MHPLSVLFLSFLFISYSASSQDTFSIVAVDTETGEVGSAGASCVDLFDFPQIANDHFIGELFPGVGAINSQAYYIPANQSNARQRMEAGDSPQEIIDWLIDNDIQNQSQFRQYGIASIVNGVAETAAHTGSSTDAYTGHRLGDNYSIQGNILLGPEILDSMESRFLRAEGNLACKLMAAMQGANVVGADSRCAPNASSSLFAYVKVAQPEDNFGEPSFLVSLRTRNGDLIEPIDSLQILFDELNSCSSLSTDNQSKDLEEIIYYPNPAEDEVFLLTDVPTSGYYTIISLEGKVIRSDNLSANKSIDVRGLQIGLYFLRVGFNEKVVTRRLIIQ